MRGERILSGLPRLRVPGILVTTSTLALLLAGCTDADHTQEDATGATEDGDAEAYGETLCESLLTWGREIEEPSRVMAALEEDDPESLEAALESLDSLATAMDAMADAAGDLVDALEEQGVPGIEGGGDQLHRDLTSAAEEIQKAFDEGARLYGSLDLLSATDQEMTEFEAQGVELDRHLKEAGGSLEVLADFDEELGDIQACQEVTEQFDELSGIGG